MVPPAPEAGADPSAGGPGPPRVGVVVLNWNAAWFTRRCLRSVATTAHPAERLRVVVVDNGSVDGSLGELADWLGRPGGPDVEVLANGDNLGFAEGCNRAIRHLLAPGPGRVDHVALVNNDAWVEPGWLAAMLEVLQRHERCAAVAARLVLEPGFVGVPVSAGDSPLTLCSARWTPSAGRAVARAGGAELLGRVRTTGLDDEGALEWPARRIWRLRARRHGTVWVPAGPGPGEVELVWREEGGRRTSATTVVDERRTVLLNGLGTALNEVGEGYDLGYGQPDPWQGSGGRDHPLPPEPTPVEGFCGGAVLLRGEALRQVGLFDPWFFAYYEDTDLAWRMRRAGWEVRTAPEAVVHHAFGASGGGGSRLHVFLDRRNWLLTNLRNGDRVQVRRASGWLRRGGWRLFRVNVFGRARRRRRVQAEPLRTWALAVLAALAVAGRTCREPRPGAAPAERVRSRLQPRGGVPHPVPWPGGPLVVYVDVGETLKAGYRAGIQRVVCSLVTEMPLADDRVEVVPVRWCSRNGRFRRLTAEEHASLRRGGAAAGPSAETRAVAGAKEGLRRTLGALGVLAAVRTARERLFGRRRRAVEDALVLERLEPGGVLLEVDAVWNELEVDRAALLGRLRGEGVGVAVFVHDLLPLEEPAWFSAHLREIFDPVVLAQLHHAQLVVCASAATADSVAQMCGRLEVEAPPIAVVPLGGELAGAPSVGPARARQGMVPPALEGRRFLLVVGTVEPRKNQGLALEVFDSLRDEFPDVHLVVAGRYGWGAEALARGLRDHPMAGVRVHWLDDVDDDGLDALYRSAFLVLVPSLAEGFGLPAVEAMGRGVPVVASSVGGLTEVAAGVSELLAPDDPAAWVRAVRAQLAGGELRREALARVGRYRPRPWADAATALDAALVAAFVGGAPAPTDGGDGVE